MIMRRAYLDACVAMYYVEQHQTLFQRVDSALFPASGEQIIPVFSDLTRMECRVLPLRNHDQALLARYEAFFQLPDCDYAHLDTIVFDLATELRAQFALRTPDALHLAAAMRSGCQEFWTNDGRLSKAAAPHIRVIVF
jgi:predicted nucleic acid-binding protein